MLVTKIVQTSSLYTCVTGGRQLCISEPDLASCQC
jgi:hypothetical protein